MTPDKARAAYPDAWTAIEQQMEDVRATGIDIITLHVQVIDVNGNPTLELLTLTNLGAPDDEAQASGVSFRATLTQRPAPHLVH